MARYGQGRGWRSWGALRCLGLCLGLAACSTGFSPKPLELAERRVEVDCAAFPSSTPKALLVADDDFGLNLRLLQKAEAAAKEPEVRFYDGHLEGAVLHPDIVLGRLAVAYARIGAYDHAIRIATALTRPSARTFAFSGIAGTYAAEGEIDAAREVAAALPEDSDWQAWREGILSFYSAAAKARSGDLAAAGRMLRGLGFTGPEVEAYMAPWLVEAGRGERALAQLREAGAMPTPLRAAALAAVAQAAFLTGNPWVGRQAAAEAHRLRRKSAYRVLGALRADLIDHLALIDLLYAERATSSARLMASQLIQDLSTRGLRDRRTDRVIFEHLLGVFELQRAYRDLEGAENTLEALRRRASPTPDAPEHWARVAATRQVWLTIMEGDAAAGLRLAEAIKEKPARCRAMVNAISALSIRGDLTRAWQLAEATMAAGDCASERSWQDGAARSKSWRAWRREAHFRARHPFSEMAFMALSAGEPETACRALTRIEDAEEVGQAMLAMANALSRAGYPELAAEIVAAAKDPEFRFHGYMEVVEPWGGGLQDRLPLQDRWGEALRYR